MLWGQVMETKYKDIAGRVICLGDTVEFYWDQHLGYSDVPDNRYTKMTDLVEEIEGVVYFTCEFGGGYAWRHAEHCRVVDTMGEK